MKSVILFAVLAFAAAVPLEKASFIFSLPEKLVIGKIEKSHSEKNIFVKHEPEKSAEETWSPASSYFVPEFITYQIHEALHYGYTPEQFSAYLLKEGFPKYVAKYFVEQFEFFKSQPSIKSPYYMFQYYYGQAIPEEVKHYIKEQVALSYKHFYKYFFLDEFKYPEGEYPEVSKSIVKYVMWHAKYYSKHAMSSLIAQFAYLQVQQAHHYVSLVKQELEKDVLPKEAHQYIYQQLQQSEQHFESLSKLYEVYKTYQQYYVPYYLIQEVYHEIHEVHQYFSNIHQYVKQQKEQGYWHESASEIYKYVECAYFTIDKIYKMFNPSEYGQYFVYGKDDLSSHPSENKYEEEYKGKLSFDHDHEFKQYPSFWHQGEYNHIPYSNGPYSEIHGYYYPAHNSSWKSYWPQQYGHYDAHKDLESYHGPYGYGYHGPYQYGYSGIHHDIESYYPHQYGYHGSYQYEYPEIHGGVYSFKPHQYGYYGPYQNGYSGIHKDFESYKPYQYGYHGPYQYGYFGAHNDQKSYTPYQHWYYNHEVYPYGYQHSAATAA